MEEETCFMHHRHHSAFPVNGFLNGECLGLTMSVFVCTHDRCRSSCQLLRLFLPTPQQSCSTGCQNGFPATGEQPPTGKPPKRPQSPTRSKQMPPNLHAAALYPRSRHGLWSRSRSSLTGPEKEKRSSSVAADLTSANLNCRAPITWLSRVDRLVGIVLRDWHGRQRSTRQYY